MLPPDTLELAEAPFTYAARNPLAASTGLCDRGRNHPRSSSSGMRCPPKPPRFTEPFLPQEGEDRIVGPAP